MNIDKFVDKINTKYKYILKGKQNGKYHIFFESYKWYLDTFLSGNNGCSKKNMKLYDPKHEFKYNSSGIDVLKIKTIKTIKNCKYIPKKIISKKKLEELYIYTRSQNITNMKSIKKKLDIMLDYNLPSSIKNITDFKTKSLKPKTLNIIIAGAGPVGMFTALYLNEIYNLNPISMIHVNLLVIDNRIAKEGVKLPYSRITQFGFDLSQFQLFIKQVFCWKSKNFPWAVNPKYSDARHFDFIIFLENLLYLSLCHFNIPTYFTKKLETFDKLKKFATKEKIDFIFDCTGGRLKTKFKDNIFKNILRKPIYKFTKGIYKVKLHDNMYKFHIKNKLYSQKTVLLHLLDKNYKPFLIGNILSIILRDYDNKIIEYCNNKCFTVNEYKKLSIHFKSDDLRYLLPNMLYEYKLQNKVKYVKFTTFDSCSHHLPYCAKKINKNLTYFAIGDALGKSEYGIKFGMNASIFLSKYICNSLSNL